MSESLVDFSSLAKAGEVPYKKQIKNKHPDNNKRCSSLLGYMALFLH